MAPIAKGIVMCLFFSFIGSKIVLLFMSVMIDFDEINRELKAVQVKASDIREIKGVLNKKFNLYFENHEAKVLEKIISPSLNV
jgi:hypothetical protein